MDNTLGLLIKLSSTSRVLTQEESDAFKDLEENIVDICNIYSNFLTSGERELFNAVAFKLEGLWRSINSRTSSKTYIDGDLITMFKQVRVVVEKLLKINLGHDLPFVSGSSNKYLVGGIWDTALIILLSRIHQLYSKTGYCVVGGVAVQLQMALVTGSDISKNIRLRAECRSTHDIDLIFPNGYKGFDSKALACHGELHGLKYNIQIGRVGHKRPMIMVLINEGGKITSTEIYMNISTSYAEAINLTPEAYDMQLYNCVEHTFYFMDKAFAFRFESVEHIIISKLKRLNDNDAYDINLLLHLYHMSNKKIDYDYIMKYDPKEFNAFLKGYLETTFHRAA